MKVENSNNTNKPKLSEIPLDIFKKLELCFTGRHTIGWGEFNFGKYNNQKVLVKNIPSKDVFGQNENVDIPYSALNSQVAELIFKHGDPQGKVAEYILMEYGSNILVCSPSFIKEGEELIEGADILDSEHQGLSRIAPNDVIIMIEDIKKQLTKRNVPLEDILNIEKQFIKDCFKNNFIGMWDPKNSNWGILYGGRLKTRLAPSYDFDLSFNIPVKFAPTEPKRVVDYYENYKNKFESGKILTDFVDVMNKKYDWFLAFLDDFSHKMDSFDLVKELEENKGITICQEQKEYYFSFIKSQNQLLKMLITQINEQNIDEKIHE